MRETSRDESLNVPSPEKLFKTKDLELLFFLRDLSQVVGRTLLDTPVTRGQSRSEFVDPPPTSDDFHFSLHEGSEFLPRNAVFPQYQLRPEGRNARGGTQLRGPALALVKGFCRAKFWAKFAFWTGAVGGQSFWRSFRACFAGALRAKKRSSQPRTPTALRNKLTKIQGKTS